MVKIGQTITIYLRLHVTINYLHLHLDIFATISCVGHICNYITTILVFIFQYEQHLVWFHPKVTIYVPLIANVTNLITTL